MILFIWYSGIVKINSWDKNIEELTLIDGWDNCKKAQGKFRPMEICYTLIEV